MTRPEHVNSYYAATANPASVRARLRGAVSADVCVIGAGFTGLAAALHLAERGYRVTVLEGARVGWGASGRNGGQINSGYAPGALKAKRLVGASDAARLWSMAEEAKEDLFARVAAHGIRCDLKKGGILAAAKASHLPELEEEFALCAGEYGYEAMRLLDRKGIRALLATERFHGGLLDEGAAHLHPLNYALGLADAAQKAGADIFEDSAALRITGGPRPVAYTAEGRVEASHLILAGNAYLGNLAPRIRSRVMPVGTYILATEPLGAARAASLIGNDAWVCDTNFVLDYFRLSADRRLLFGGRVSYTGREPQNLAGKMRARLLRTYPQLTDVRTDYVWGGHVAITANRLPHFGRLGEERNIYFAQGFSGQGVALTGLAGKLMAEAVAGTAERFDLFAKIPHAPFPGGRALRMPLLVLAMAYYRLRDLL